MQNLSMCVRVLPEANNRTLLADVTLGLMFGRLCSSHSVQDGEPNHRLGLQTHPIDKLPGLQLHLIGHLGIKETVPTVRSLSIKFSNHVKFTDSIKVQQTVLIK